MASKNSIRKYLFFEKKNCKLEYSKFNKNNFSKNSIEKIINKPF